MTPPFPSSAYILHRSHPPIHTLLTPPIPRFFQNTGAVAGVFSVVGLIALAVIIAFITNTIRRRRARKFDKELAAATMEAASAPAPIFLDDDDDDERYKHGYGAGAGYGGGAGGMGGGGSGRGVGRAGSGGYSDVSSHGTYGQPPMDSYGMREMHHGGGVGAGVGEIYDPYGGAGAAGVGAAGAAGIGVARARSQRDGGAYAAALQDGGSPYPAFVAHQPGVGQPPQGYGGGHDAYATGVNPRNLELLEAAGMGAHYNQQQQSQYQPQPHYQTTSQVQQQQQLHNRSPSRENEYANLGRNKSLGPSGMGSREGEYGAGPASASTTATQYYSPMVSPGGAPGAPAGAFHALGDPTHGQPQQYQGQAQYQQPHQHQQQPHQHQAHQGGYAVGDDDDDDDDAYGGYVAEHSQSHVVGAGATQTPTATTPSSGSGSNEKHGMPNPFDAPVHAAALPKYEDRGSVYDDEEEEAPRRVLKVANE
ncbi:hypothetical protein B0H34DRAFT_286215 [Crassisporium funariophilum]|nr:hypothetical protein B0H34DRAFT_286215 [Crassisporium funariophilum]